MSKLTRKEKLEIYQRRRAGESLSSLSREFKVNISGLQYLISLLDLHGPDILRQEKNRYYSPEVKLAILHKALNGSCSVNSIALASGLLSRGQLFNWIKSYKANGYVIVEGKRGRPPTMKKENKQAKSYDTMNPDEKLKFLEAKNLYLEAENAYLKKLRAVVQARKNQAAKKK